MRVAVTGAGGRLGRALVAAFAEAPFAPLGAIEWRRPDFDLDGLDDATAMRLLQRDRPEIVVHAAAWTDVDGVARDPEAAGRRNGDATGALARACVSAGVDLLMVSTNEVFDGRRSDGRGYAAADPPAPINPYGASKLRGERLATDAWTAAGHDAPQSFETNGRPARGPQLAIVRTAWLYGPPGNDFPAKILAAADRAATSCEPLRLVADEIGSPTYTADLAEAIVELVGAGTFAGIHHVVNAGAASRADWARSVLDLAGVQVATEDVPASTWSRSSTPPAWAVLAPTPLPGPALRPWQEAVADYVPGLVRSLAAASAR